MKNILNKEINHFLTLTRNAREVILSNFLFDSGSIFVGVFTNAFLFINSDENIPILIFYNAAYFVGIFITFPINGLLLRSIRINYIYLFGLIMQGITPLVLIFLNQYLGNSLVIILGFIGGAGAGFYWANRNYLELNSTNDNSRDYFFAIVNTLYTISGMALPVVAGTFINWFRQDENLNVNIAYFIIMAVALIVYLIAGLILINNKFTNPKVNRFFIKKSNPMWQKVRFTAFLFSFNYATYLILPTILILTLVGKENALGLVETIGAAISAIILYTIGRKIKPQQRNISMFATVIISIIAVLGLQIFWGLIGVLIFIFVYKICYPIQNNTTAPFWYSGIEKSEENPDEHYQYIVDLEIFINLGRLTAFGAFLIVLYYFGQENSIRIMTVLMVIMNIFMSITFNKHKKRSY